MVRLMGLWSNEGEKGKYLSGRLGSARIVILKNKHKESDNHPDFIMYIKENETDHSKG